VKQINFIARSSSWTTRNLVRITISKNGRFVYQFTYLVFGGGRLEHMGVLQWEQRTEELEIAQTDLRDLSGKLLQLQDEERRKIARDLHDSAGQSLAVLGMNLVELVKRANKIDSQFSKKATEAQDLVQNITNEIRTMSYLLHPPLLDESGIAAALDWYTAGLAKRTQLKITLDIDPELGRLSREVELTMFRIIQECLTNILRHSQSKDVLMRIQSDGKQVSMKIQDHGIGISDEKLASLNAGGSGVGMRGMKQRVRQLLGEMNVVSGNGGTTISITLPIQFHLDGQQERERTRPHDRNQTQDGERNL
jgi:signal transduction histidine kinase